MPRALAAAPAAIPLFVILALTLGGCTAESPKPTDAAPAPTTTAAAPASSSRLPSCDAVTAAVGSLVDGLTYDEATSDTNTAEEAYDQRVCVFISPDANTQLGVTIAAIPFQQGELDSYATLPNAIADTRLAAYGAVLQTFAADDAADGHLDSSLYLFDTAISITIQGLTKDGSTAATLPQLTVPAATDAAFAVRALID